MMTETKLRSFNVENPNIYQRFKQIQLERGKTSTQRLNELIARDVKEAALAGSTSADTANAPAKPKIIHLPKLTIYERPTMTNQAIISK